MVLRALLTLLLICTPPLATLAHAGCLPSPAEPAGHAEHAGHTHHSEHAHSAAQAVPADADCCDRVCLNLCVAATALLPPAVSPGEPVLSLPVFPPPLAYVLSPPPDPLLRPPSTLAG